MNTQRFMSHVQPIPETGCWIWDAATLKGGYGVLDDGQKTVTAHRHSFKLFKGEITGKMQVLHDCDIRSCVNPSHLYLGSHKQNMNDRNTRNRQAKGEKHGMFGGGIRGSANKRSKLTEQDVLEIRASKEQHCNLAKHFGVTQSAIWNIINRKTWKHL